MSVLPDIARLRTDLDAAVIGQERLVSRLLIALLVDGHLLVEGAPGLAKTRAVRALAERIEADYQRVQFTPDLLPADLTGTEVYRPADGSFVFQRGPLFNNLVLADEINRAPAKVQSALLEAMAEQQISVGHETYALPAPFMVMATQNPIEQEGTYPLPEAQLDRFLMHVTVGYPDAEREAEILRLVRAEAIAASRTSPESGGARSAVLTRAALFAARREVLDVYLSETLEDYLVRLIVASREPARHDAELARWLAYGASPRGTIALEATSRAHAWLDGRDYVSPADVQEVVHDVLRHRLLLSYEAEADGVTADVVIDAAARARRSAVSVAADAAAGGAAAARTPARRRGRDRRLQRRRLPTTRAATAGEWPAFASPVTTSLDELVRLRGGRRLRSSRRVRRGRAPLDGVALSRRLGRGLDFAEVRAYQPGDDVRAIDWRVTARSGRAHTKLFTEERERPVLLVVDTRASMRFGTRGAYKSVLAARLAAVLGWSAVAGRDRVGGFVLGDDWHAEVRPRSGRSGLMSLFRDMVEGQASEPRGGRDGAPGGSLGRGVDDASGRVEPDRVASASALGSALSRLRHVAQPGCTVVILSDFFGFDEDARGVLGALSHTLDLLPVLVSDPLERELPPSGRYELAGESAAGRLTLAIGGRRQRERHAERFAEHRRAVAAFFASGGRTLLHVSTDEAVAGGGRAGAGARTGAVGRLARSLAREGAVNEREALLAALRDPQPPPVGWWPPAPGLVAAGHVGGARLVGAAAGDLVAASTRAPARRARRPDGASSRRDHASPGCAARRRRATRTPS